MLNPITAARVPSTPCTVPFPSTGDGLPGATAAAYAEQKKQALEADGRAHGGWNSLCAYEPLTVAFRSTVSRTGCPNHGCRWSRGRSAVAGAPYIFSKVATTSPIVASGATHPSWMSGKSSLQFSHFFPLAKRMGHQKLSTLRSISAPRAYTPVIQSQYRHQIRSCPTRPWNFWRLTFTQSAWRYRGSPTRGVRIG